MTIKIITCLAAAVVALAACTETQKAPTPPASPEVEKSAAPQNKPPTTTEPTTVAGDPSEVALENQGVFGDEPYGERYRILADLDDDNQNDLILSDDVRSFGKSGGTWNVFLRRGSAFLNVGEIFAHQAMIAFEVDHARNNPEDSRAYSRIWVYHHLSGSEGGISYFVVRPKSVDDAGGGLVIYTGDGGSEQGNGVVDAIFKHSEIPFRLEVSKTDEKGKVGWQKYAPY